MFRDVKRGTFGEEPQGHTGWSSVLHITSDGRRAVSTGNDATVRVWDVRTGRQIHCLPVPARAVTPDAKRAVTVQWSNPECEGQLLRVWDVESGACQSVQPGVPDFVTALSTSPDSRRAASASRDGTVRIWDLISGRCLRVLPGHSHYPDPVVFTQDNRGLVVWDSPDCKLRLWDPESGRCLNTTQAWYAGKVVYSALSPDGRLAALASRGYHSMQVWHIEGGHPARTLRVKEIQEDPQITVWRLTPDGRRALSGGHDGIVRLWDLRSDNHRSGVCIRKLEGHSGWITAMEVSADGRLAVSAAGDSTLRAWNLDDGDCAAHYVHACTVTSLALHRGCLVAGDESGEILFVSCDPLDRGVPTITALRQYHTDTRTWNDEVTAACPSCGSVFAAPGPMLDAVHRIGRNAGLSEDQSPCLMLPDEAWDESRLLSECPTCHGLVRFNPFVVDRLGRY